MPSSIQAGNTGSGKSEALKLFLAWILAIYKSAAVVYDPKGPLFYELVAYYVGQGREKRIVAHAFGGDYVLGLDLWEWSTENGIKKENDDGLIKSELAQLLVGAQSGKPLSGQMLKQQYFDMACDICRHQPRQVPIDWLYDALDPGSDNFKRLLRDCTHEETKRQMQSLAAKYDKNEFKFWELVDPARRLLKPLKHPLIVAMANAKEKLDLRQTLKDKMQIVFSGAGIDDDTNRILCLLIQRRVYAISKEAADAGKLIPVEVILEEAGATRTRQQQQDGRIRKAGARNEEELHCRRAECKSCHAPSSFELKTYRKIAKVVELEHDTVNYGSGEYIKGTTHTNTIENF